MNTTIRMVSAIGNSPHDAAVAYGMTPYLIGRYLEVIAERDDFLEWQDEGGSWTINPVPTTGIHLLDTETGRTGYRGIAGGFVYDEEPDCIVSLCESDGRFVEVENGYVR